MTVRHPRLFATSALDQVLARKGSKAHHTTGPSSTAGKIPGGSMSGSFHYTHSVSSAVSLAAVSAAQAVHWAQLDL